MRPTAGFGRRPAAPGGEAAGSAGPAPVPLVRLEAVTRRFGAVLANDRVSLDILPGEVHGLVGENGAGKSTLMRLLYGLHRPDSGRILLSGEPVVLRSPRDALARGIGMVHQHFMLVPTLNVLDNILLGAEPMRGPFLDRAAARRRLLERAGPSAAGLDLERAVGDLTVAQQQRVEILKLLYRDARLLILDEPTAVLSPGEAEALFDEVRRLSGEGRTVVLITHRLAEVLGHTDRVSVLRQGRLVLSGRTPDLTLDELARAIVGGEAPAGGRRGRAEESAPRVPVLEMEDVRVRAPGGRGGLKGMTLTVRAGEILAVVGVDGNGQGELARVAAGRMVPAAGRLVRDGTPVPAGRAAPSSAAAVGYIPEDRQRDGMLAAMTVAENFLLGRQREARFRKGLRLDRSAVLSHARRLIESGDVRPPDPAQPAGALSGGNQQKMVVTREVEESPGLIVATHPTRGLDLKAAAAVHAALRDRRDRGAAVLLITAELDEARSLADRLVVVFDGRVAGELDPTAAGDRELGLLMTGAGGA